MKKQLTTFLLMTVLVSTVWGVDYVVIQGGGIWKKEDNDLIKTTGTTDRVIVLNGTPTPTPDPIPDDPDPSPINLADRAAKLADAVAEPGARSAFAVLYRQAAEGKIKWDVLISLRTLLLSGSRTGWRNVFDQIDTEVEKAGRSPQSLLQVAIGLERKNALSKVEINSIPEVVRGRPATSEVNWIGVVTCLLQHLLPNNATEIVPTPDLNLSPTLANPPLFKSTREGN